MTAMTVIPFGSFPALLAVLGLLVAYSAAWVLYARLFHPLSKYPGPFLASVTRLWLVVDVAKGKTDLTQRALHKKYGG